MINFKNFPLQQHKPNYYKIYNIKINGNANFKLCTIKLGTVKNSTFL